jgi:hypothetical protein
VKTLALVTLALALFTGCRREPAPEQRGAAAEALTAREILLVPRVSGPVQLDAEIDEPDWSRAARTGAFVDGAGVEARPYSDARFLWDDENLYVALYAGDDDIRTRVKEHDGPVWLDDAFSIHLAPAAGSPTYVIEISAGGVITDGRRDEKGKLDLTWESKTKLAVDVDGSLNDASDEDEEWVIEAAIPLRALGARAGDRLLVDLSRCDTPRAGVSYDGAASGPKPRAGSAGAQRRCGSFGTAKDRRLIELSR